MERIDGTRSNLDRDDEYVRMTRDIEKLRKDISHLESPDELNNLVPDGGEAESDFQAASKPLELFLRNSVKGGDFSPGPANVQFIRALRDAKASMIEFRDHFGFASLSPSDVLERLNARADQRSGTISEDGFCSALYKMHQSTFKKANKERQIMKESDANALSVLLFRAFDFDNNNVLDVFELSAGLSLLCAGSPASLLANVFRTFDEDGNDFLSNDEFVSYLSHIFALSFTMCPRLHLVCVDPESAASDIRKRLSSIYSVDRGEQTKQGKQLSGFLPRLSITTPVAVDMTTLQDEKRRRVDVRMLAHHAAARIFNSIDKESSSARSRDGLISFADMIGWLSRNGLIYHLKDESDYPPLPEEDVEEPPPPEEEEKLTPSQLKWHEISKTHASDGMYFTSKPEPRPQNRRSTLDSFLDTSKYKNSESDLRKAHEHLEIVDQQAREAASKGKRHALKREFEVYVRAWSSRISLFHYVTQITRISLTHTTRNSLENQHSNIGTHVLWQWKWNVSTHCKTFVNT